VNEGIAYYWDQLTPDQRKRVFRFSKKALFVYSKWSDLTDHERDIIINAARIIAAQEGRPRRGS